MLVNNRSILNDRRFNKHIKFFPYLNDVKGFYPYVDELKKSIFKFKKTHIHSAESHLWKVFDSHKTIKANFKNLKQLKKNHTLVSIHVRLGDYEEHLKKVFGLPVVSNDYFTKAMTFMYKKYPVRDGY